MRAKSKCYVSRDMSACLSDGGRGVGMGGGGGGVRGITGQVVWPNETSI